MLYTALLAISAENPLNLAPIIFAAVIFITAVGALVGFWRGFMRQTVRAVTIIISAIMSFAVMPLIYKAVIKSLSEMPLSDMKELLLKLGANSSEWVESLDVHATRLMLSIPLSLVIMPIVFVVLFIVINKLMLIIHKIACALCGFKTRRNTVATRLLGLLLGGVQGLVVAGLILMPVIGASGVARSTVEIMNTERPDDSFTKTATDVYGAYAKSVCESPITVAYGMLGIESLYESIATVEVDGIEYNMTKLLPDSALISSDVTKLSGCDPKSLTPDEKAIITSIIEKVEKSPLLTDILASAVRSGSYSYKIGSFPVKAGEPFDTLINSALEIFHTSSPENIISDLKTMSEIYFTLSDSGILTSFYDGSDSVLSIMTATAGDGETTANKVTSIIKSNERMTPLLTLIAKMSVTVMSNGAGVSEDSFEIYEDVKASLNKDVLTINREDFETDGEYIEEVSLALDTALQDSGIELDSEILDSMAEYIAENFSEAEELTDEMACDIFLSYYDAYLEYVGSGDNPES